MEFIFGWSVRRINRIQDFPIRSEGVRFQLPPNFFSLQPISIQTWQNRPNRWSSTSLPHAPQKFFFFFLTFEVLIRLPILCFSYARKKKEPPKRINEANSLIFMGEPIPYLRYKQKILNKICDNLAKRHQYNGL